MFSLSWLKDALERALKTAAQSLFGVLSLNGIDILHLDWGQTASLVGTATVLSILTSVLSSGGANPGTASLTKAIVAAPRHELREPSAGTKVE